MLDVLEEPDVEDELDDAAGFASEEDDEEDDVEEAVEDFDAGALELDEPRLSFR